MSQPDRRAEITLAGQTVWLYADGSCYLPDDQLLVLSDLHLEKARAQSQGAPLPALDSIATLQQMQAALKRAPAKSCILLGDSFHRSSLASQLAEPLQAQLAEYGADTELIWIEGNHDPDLPDHLPGRRAAEVALGPLIFRHIPGSGNDIGPDQAEIGGHFHPKARLRLAARRLSGRCFITDYRRLILPAFGVWTGGLNILDPAIAGLLDKQKTVFFCHDGKIWTLPFKSGNFLP